MSERSRHGSGLFDIVIPRARIPQNWLGGRSTQLERDRNCDEISLGLCGIWRKTEDVFAKARQAAAQEGACTRTPGDQRRCSQVMGAEDHARARNTGCRGDRERPSRGRASVRDSLDFCPRLLRLEMTSGKLIDHRHHRSDATHVDTGRFSAIEAH
jgi:hypothetical protein